MNIYFCCINYYFTKFCCLENVSTMQCAILSSWNYILGPQIEKLWFKSIDSCVNLSKLSDDALNEFNASKYFKHRNGTNNELCQFDMKTYCMMCGQLLLGVDLSKIKFENSSRFYLTRTNILVCVIFQVKTWHYSGTSKKNENVSLCFGVIFERGGIDFVLEKYFIIDSQLRKISSLIQKCETPELPVERISAIVDELMLILDSLIHYNLSNIKICEESLLSSTGTFIKATVSHLQTSGKSVIVGASEYKINELISVLSMFTSDAELQNCLAVAPKPLVCGIYGIFIQGSFKKTQEECEFLLENAAKESLPLTVVDTDMNKVWQTLPFQNDSKKTKNFYLIEDVGLEVPELFKCLRYKNKSVVDYKRFINYFCKTTARKSVALIKAVEHCRSKEKLLSKRDARTMLGLCNNTDLQIILGFAQKIKPGIREFVL